MTRHPESKIQRNTALRFIKLRGVVKNDAFYFTLAVNGIKVPNMMLDTGAVELTFNGLVAKALKLPNLGSVRVSGIGGVTRAYRSRCNLWLGKLQFRNVPCIVVPGFSNPGLFGLRFFIDNHLKLELNPKSQICLISPASN